MYSLTEMARLVQPRPALPLALLSSSPFRIVVRLPPVRPRLAPRVLASISIQPEQQQRQQQQELSLTNVKDASWQDFARSVVGEWDGYGAEFSSSGEPKELPSAVVPEAFREWEVQLYDWQTQCPTTITDQSLQYKLIRLLPTVGCEADAATQYSVDERLAGDPHSGVDFLAFHVSGSYVAVWPGRRILRENFRAKISSKTYSLQDDDKQAVFEVEHCLVQDEAEPRFRVRVVQQIMMEASAALGSRCVPVLKNITVQREKWESEYRNGEVLGGCGTSGSAFAITPALQASELSGLWQCNSFSTQSEPSHARMQPLVPNGSNAERRECFKSILPLPKGIWSKITVLEEGGFTLAAGWLVDSNNAIFSNCEFFSNRKAKGSCIRFERRVNE